MKPLFKRTSRAILVCSTNPQRNLKAERNRRPRLVVANIDKVSLETIK